MNTIKNSGMREMLYDPRDYSLFKTFGVGVVTLKDLPEKYEVSVPKIKNQLTTDFCGAESSVAVNEDQEEVEFSPEWQFAQIKKIEGDYRTYGADLRTTAKALTKVGSLPKEKAPYSVISNDRDFLANWNNWPQELLNEALPFRKDSFFSVTKLNCDLFDSIRIALWQNRLAKRSVLTGSVWYDEWTYGEGGVIPESYDIPAGLHMYKIYGWVGEFLKIQNSYGEEIGDKGVFYMPRQVANAVLTKGMFMFRDLPEGINPIPTGNIFEVIFYKLKLLFCD